MVEMVEYNGRTFAAVDYDGEILFWAKEVCEYLEYNKSTKIADVVRVHTDEDERVLLKNRDLGKIQSRFENDFESESRQNGGSEVDIKLANRGEWFVTELGLYGLIFGSTKKEAIQFKRWAKETIRDLRVESGLRAFESFRMMDKEIQKKCASFIADNGKLGDKADNIVMNKAVNQLTSEMYDVDPPINKGDMEKHHPEMMIDRQKMLSDYCILYGYTGSHREAKKLIKGRFKELSKSN